MCSRTLNSRAASLSAIEPLSRILVAAALIVGFGGNAMVAAQEKPLRPPKRLASTDQQTDEATFQTVSHRTVVAKAKGFFRRPLANRMAAFVPRGKHSLQTGSACICPACDHVCHLDADQVDVDRKCFECESKVICIPRVVFPWQKKKCASCDSCDGVGCSHCVHNGAKTREIKLLKVKKYQCPECKYTWSAKHQPACCDGECDAACEPSCDLSCPEVGPYSNKPMIYREFDQPVGSAAEPSDGKVQELTAPRA